ALASPEPAPRPPDTRKSRPERSVAVRQTALTSSCPIPRSDSHAFSISSLGIVPKPIGYNRNGIVEGEFISLDFMFYTKCWKFLLEQLKAAVDLNPAWKNC